MDAFLQDFRYSLRLLRKHRGFAAVAILTLALGIGANTAIFSVTNALFIRPLAVPEPNRVVRLYAGTDGQQGYDVTSYVNYITLRNRAHNLEELAAHAYTSVSFSTGNLPENLNGEVVSGNYFRALSLPAEVGRAISPDDDGIEGAHPVAVISLRLWERRFQSDPAAVGKKVYLNGQPFTLIGVMPENFRGSYMTEDADIWMPIAMHEQVRPRGVSLTNAGWGWLNMTGRLKRDTTIEQAQSEINQLTIQLRKEYPDANKDLSFRYVPAGSLPEQTGEDLAKALAFLTVVAGLVLLVVCANIAGAFLPRVIARRRETAIRHSLGATHMRLIRQWLTESFALSLVGGAAGILVAIWCKEGFKVLLPPEWQTFAGSFTLDKNVLVFAFLVSLLTGTLCGIAPALHLWKTEVNSSLKGDGTGAPRYRLFGAFVAAQTSVSLVLLIVAGLLLRSLVTSSTFDAGFNTKGLALASMDVRRNGYDEQRGREYYRQLIERLKALPSVRSASYALVTPLGFDRESLGFEIEGYHPPSGDRAFTMAYNIVGPEYFATMEIPVLRGRDFHSYDMRANSEPVAIINETLAKKFWPNADCLGKQIQLTGGPGLKIVGVSRNIQYYTLGEEPQPYVYISLGSSYSGQMTLQVRTSGDPEQFTQTLTKEIAAFDPEVAPSGVITFSKLRQLQLFPARALATISILTGLLALILTALGIYGVLSYAVTQRTREIGIRVALGATRKAILQLILGQGMAFALSGAAIGLIAAFGATRFLSSLLFQVSPRDGISFGIVTLFVILVALLAGYIPARRAVRIDPMTALRYE